MQEQNGTAYPGLSFPFYKFIALLADSSFIRTTGRVESVQCENTMVLQLHLVNLARKIILVGNYDVITRNYWSEVPIGFCTAACGFVFTNCLILFLFLALFVGPENECTDNFLLEVLTTGQAMSVEGKGSLIF